jgi:putative transposase
MKKVGKHYRGRYLWSKGYCVSTLGLDEDHIRRHLRWQEQKDKASEQVAI